MRILIHIIRLLFLFTFIFNYGYSQTRTQTNRLDADWNDKQHWTGPAPGYCTNHSVIIAHNDFIYEPLVINSGNIVIINANRLLITTESITVDSGGTLIVNGTLIGVRKTQKLRLEKHANLFVNTEGYISWGGSLIINSSKVNINIKGNINVNGKFVNGTTLKGDGQVIVYGGYKNLFGTSPWESESKVDYRINGNPYRLNPDNIPVELICFKVDLYDDTIAINWVTSKEFNNDYFIVERSTDGVNFKEFNRVKGKGNCNIISNYSSVDKNPLSGILYYRLKQVSYDGGYNYSNTIELDNKNNKTVVYVSGLSSLW